MQILIEVTQGDGWSEMGRIGQGDILGSITDVTNGRDILLFGWWEGVPGVYRAVGGIDQDFGGLRKLETAGVETLSNLHEPYETPVITPTSGLLRVRWTLLRDEAAP